jgi:exopolysaccharide biosynthesis protein
LRQALKRGAFFAFQNPMKTFFVSRPLLRSALAAMFFCHSIAFAQTPVGSTPDTPGQPVLGTAQIPAAPLPPQSQAYVRVRPGAQVIEGHTLVPVAFLKSEMGASIQTLVANSQWRISYFGRTIDVFNNQHGALLDGAQTQFDAAPRILNGNLFVPFKPIAAHLGFKWSVPNQAVAGDGSTLMLLQFPAAYIENIRHSVEGGKVRVVLDLSNATRVTARLTAGGVILNLAAARRAGIPGTLKVGDIAVPRVTTTSGNWKAGIQIKLNYAAPASWHTLDNPPRIVVDVQKIFESSSDEALAGGLTFSKIVRGTDHGPVRLFVAKVDPRQGWRVRVAPAGYSVLQRNRVSQIAAARKAPLAINGGFFAFDGAAVGAVKVQNEWIRLPWKGRTAIGFQSNGAAKIGNLQVNARAQFSNGLSLPIRDLNGWPDKNRITALTRRFRHFYALRPGEMAVVVNKGVVTSTPGGGGVSVPSDGFVLVGNGGAIPELKKVRKGLRAKLDISAIGWNGIVSALGGGPRLVVNGQVDVRDEGFRSDVTSGRGPRTAMGIDKFGRYILVVADGRQGFYSSGLTLTELAYTLQKLGAVDALNFDGGGSTAMVVRGKIINRPSDGGERRVSNALIVTR